MLRCHLFAFAAILFASSAWQQVQAQQAGRAPRVFAPGVETTIPVSLDPAETTSRHEMVEIRAQKKLDWQPELLNKNRTLYSQAAEALFTRDLWQLEFSFKPLRMIRLVTSSGEQRLVWYMVYRVKNTGTALSPQKSEETGAFTSVEVKSGPIRFSPHAVLQGQDVAPNGGKIYRAYLDKIVPGALEPIRQRETPGRELLSSVQMPLEPLAEGAERWGVLMWEGIDPEMDFFSVFIRGLTNAYQWTDPAGAYAAGDSPGKGREFAKKVLQLNFWRPGDRFLQHENEVRYGVPAGKGSLYGTEDGVAHQWVYR